MENTIKLDSKVFENIGKILALLANDDYECRTWGYLYVFYKKEVK